MRKYIESTLLMVLFMLISSVLYAADPPLYEAGAGVGSIIAGYDNKANGDNAIAIGSSNGANSANSIAIGYSNNYDFTEGFLNDGQYASSTAVGISNILSGKNSNAFGYNNIVKSDYGTAIGSENIVDEGSDNATAVGYSNEASGLNSTAIGYDNTASNKFSTAVGYTNDASGINSSAVGYYNSASKKNSSAVGSGNKAYEDNSSSFGFENTTTAKNSSAFGSSNNATKVNSSAFGTSNNAKGDNSSAFGYNNTTSEENSSAFGYKNEASGASGSAFGYLNESTKDNSSSFGYQNHATGLNGSAFGSGNTASNNNSSAFGYNNTASKEESSAFGNINEASGKYSSAFGYNNKALGINSSAFGYSNTASKEGSTSFGYGNTASGIDSSAFGFKNFANDEGSSAVGFSNIAAGNYSSAFGYSNTASKAYNNAFGYKNYIAAEYGSAFGSENYVDEAAARGVAIGYQAVVKDADTVSFGHSAGDSYFDELGVSHTYSDDRFVRLTHVATGTAATDAVNKGQMEKYVADNATTSGGGGGGGGGSSGFSPDSDQTAAMNSGITSSKVSTYDSYITDSGLDANSNVIANVATGSADTDAINLGQMKQYLSENGAAIEGDQLLAINSGITADKVTAYDTYITDSGLNANSNVIANVEAGVNDTDAVNVGQLKLKQDALSEAQLAAADSGITADKVSAYDSYATYITSSGLNANSQTITNVAAGVNDTDAVNVGQLKLKQDALTEAQLAAVNSGITAAKVATYDGYATYVTSSGLNANSKKITNVANGTDASDAVNKGQLDAVSSSVSSTISSTVSSAVAGKQDALTETQLAAVNSGITADKVATYDGYATYVTSSGLNANNSKITNVADGEASSDAVNKGQLDAVSSSVSSTISSTVSSAVAGKQDTLTETQLAAVNSGITADKVATYEGYATYVTSSGLNANSKKITNVADGEASSDAVNKGQLDAVSSSVSSTISSTVSSSVSSAVAGKQDALTETQLAAVNSGITADKVATYEGYATYVTSSGLNANSKKITNVANGTDASDAVNKSQLDAVSSSVTSVSSSVSSVSSAVSSVSSAVDSKQDALSSDQMAAVDSGITAAKVATYDGYATYVTSSGLNANDKVITSVATGSANTDAINLGQMKQYLSENGAALVGDQLEAVNSGITSADVTRYNLYITSSGLDANSQKITNVVAGTANTDAVNVGQLNLKQDALTETQLAAVNSGITSAKVATYDGYATYVTSSGLNANDKAITSVATGSANTDAINLGQMKKYVADNAASSLSTGQQSAVDSGITSSDVTRFNLYITSSGLDANSHVISNVANGVADSDAVNVGQLKLKQDALSDAQLLAVNSGITAGKVSTYDSYATYITSSGLNANSHIIRNVAAGTDATDAVNVGQLNLKQDALTEAQLAAVNSGITSTKISNYETYITSSGLNANNKTIASVATGSANTDAINLGQMKKYVADNAASSLSTEQQSAVNSGITSTKISNYDTYITSSGLNANDKVITSVATGSANTDAINLGQMKKYVADNAASSLSTEQQSAVNSGITSTKISNYDTYITSSGLNANNNKITNVANGTADSDAVNVGQLKLKQDALSESQLSAVNSGITSTKISNYDTYVTTSGLFANNKTITGVATGSANTDAINLGQMKKYVADNAATSLTEEQQAAVNSGVTSTDVTRYNLYVKDSGLDANSKKIANVADGTDAKDAVNKGQLDEAVSGYTSYITPSGLFANDKQITGVATGTEDTHAINLGQMKEYVAENAATSLSEEQQAAVNSGITADKVATYESYASYITPSGLDANSNRITNIADGIDAGDAVNKGQLDAAISGYTSYITSSGLNGNSNRITNIAAGEADTDAVNVSQIKTAYVGAKYDSATGKLTLTRKNGETSEFTLPSGNSGSGAGNGGADPVLVSQVSKNTKDISIIKKIQEGLGYVDEEKINEFTNGSISIGSSNNSLTDDGTPVISMAIGNENKVTGQNSIAIGYSIEQIGNTVSGDYSIALGFGNKVTGHRSGVFGDPTIIDSDNSYSVGNDNTITGDNSFILGNKAVASGKNSMVFGNKAKVTADNGIALGNNTVSSQKNAVAIGEASVAKAENAVSLGSNAEASGKASMAFGSSSKVSADNSIAFGSNAIASHKNAVAIGAGSKTTADNTVSVGSESNKRRITNVAEAEEDNDAVNYSQLKSYVATNAGGANSQEVLQLRSDLNDLDSRVSKVGASAGALAALKPMEFNPDNKWSAGVGFGNLNGKSAAAIGIFYRPNPDVYYSIGGNVGGEENIVNAGVSFSFGHNGRRYEPNQNVYKVITGKDVEAEEKFDYLNQQNSKLRDKVAVQDAEIISQKGEIDELKHRIKALEHLVLQMTKGNSR